MQIVQGIVGRYVRRIKPRPLWKCSIKKEPHLWLGTKQNKCHTWFWALRWYFESRHLVLPMMPDTRLQLLEGERVGTGSPWKVDPGPFVCSPDVLGDHGDWNIYIEHMEYLRKMLVFHTAPGTDFISRNWNSLNSLVCHWTIRCGESEMSESEMNWGNGCRLQTFPAKMAC
jgi:hypothetical protein